MFFSSDLGTTTFERSRRFDVDDVADDELHAIADEIRSRFGQQSVLTFDHLPASDDEVDAVELEVPSVKAQDLREGLLADQTAREELFGGSVTLDGRLLLVAELADAQLARDFAERIGGDLRRAAIHYGERDFVEGPAPVRVERRTLIVEGGPEAETVDPARAIRPARGGPRRRARSRSSASASIASASSSTRNSTRWCSRARAPTSGSVCPPPATAPASRARWGHEPIELDGVDVLRLAAKGGADRVAVEALDATDTFQVDADLGAADGEVDRTTVRRLGRRRQHLDRPLHRGRVRARPHLRALRERRARPTA